MFTHVKKGVTDLPSRLVTPFFVTLIVLILLMHPSTQCQTEATQ